MANSKKTEKLPLPRGMSWIFNPMARIPLTWQMTLKRWFLTAIDMPILGGLYSSLYFSSKVNRRACRLPTLITLEPFNICDLRCVMCPYPAMSRPKVQMSLDLFQKIVDDAVGTGIKQLCLHVYNEPLLDNLLLQRVSYAKSRGMQVGFNSNGMALTEDKAEEILQSGLDWITFSFDGASKETYEKIRVGAKFEEVVSNIRRLIELRDKRGIESLFIRVSGVVQRDNYPELSSQGRRQFHHLFRGADEINLQIVDTRQDNTSIMTPLNLGLKKRAIIYPCPRLWHEFIILSSGKLALCCMDYNGTIEIGDMNEQTISEIWQSPKFREIRQVHLRGEGTTIRLCSSCSIIHHDAAYGWWRL